MLDIFKSDAFSVVSLTDAINRIKFVPSRISRMNLFSTTSIATTTASIEERDGILVLVNPTPRGGPGQTVPKTTRTLRAVPVPHFQIDDAVMAEEVQGVRAFGSETEVETVMGKISERMAIHTQSLDVTEEFSRLGAIKGIVTYADGTTLNLFTLFGVAQEAEIDFDLDNPSPAGGALRKKVAGVARQIAGILEGLPYRGIHAFCGDAFFDDLIAHPEVRATYLQTVQAAELRAPYIDGGYSGSYGSFEFGGITWENYRGAVGTTQFVNTDKCHIFPEGVPGLFRSVYAPADYIETVNTLGRPRYMKQWTMPNEKGINMEVQTNVLHYATRPKVLLLGRRT